MFGPGVIASATAATQNRSQVESGIIATGFPRRLRGASCATSSCATSSCATSLRVPERREERARRALDGGAVGRGHLAAPDADAIALGRPRKVRVDARAVLARDHASAHVSAPLE